MAAREARPGYDGHVFVREALERGAAGVVLERPCPEAGRLQVVVPDGVAAHARICQALAGDPSRQIVTMGVTGSFGKTITSLMVRSIIEAAGERCGLVGSLGFCDGTSNQGDRRWFRSSDRHGCRRDRRPWPRHDRQPGAFRRLAQPDCAALLAEMVQRRCKGGVLEVSGEALTQRSFDGVAFHAARRDRRRRASRIPDRRLAAKATGQGQAISPGRAGGVAVVNADDPNAEMLGWCQPRRAVAWPLLSSPAAVTRGAIDVTARLERIDGSGTRMRLHGFNRELSLHLPLVGIRVSDLCTGRRRFGMGHGDRPGPM